MGLVKVRRGCSCGCRGHMDARVARLSPPTIQALPGEQGQHLHYTRMGICWQASLLWVEMVGGGATNTVGSTKKKKKKKRVDLLILKMH